VQFPDDENGDVLRRMAASGFDFGRVHPVDFFAIFPARANAESVARQLIEADRSAGALASVTTGAHPRGTELRVSRKMLISHAGITAYEQQLGETAVAQGGAVDGWGVEQGAAEGEAANGQRGASAPAPAGVGTEMDSPRDGLDEAERDFIDGIGEHGWMQTQALDEDDKPGFSFTTGFQFSIGHPEILAFKIDRQVANRIFWLLYRCARNGKPVPRATRTTGIVPGDEAYVFPIARRHYADYLGWSRWFYRGDDFECLQIVWPDEAGLFPWEDGFDPRYANAQVDLTEKGWAVEAAGKAA
jgi:hypothetical protein